MTQKTPYESPEQNIAYCYQAQAQSAGTSLHAFPPKIQKAVIDVVLDATPMHGTDIWYHDETNNTVRVILHGMQWTLNQTAAALWLQEGKKVKDILKQIQKAYPDHPKNIMELQVVEFLINYASYGLFNMFPETIKEDK